MGTGSIRNKMFVLLAVMGAIPLLVVIIATGFRMISEMERTAMTDNWLRNNIIEEHLTELFEKNFYALHALANSPLIRQYAASPNESQKAALAKLLTDSNKIFHDENLMALTGADGQQLFRTDGAPLVNISKREHFQKAMKGVDYISDVIVSMSTGKMIVVLEVPVLDDQNRPVGMLQRNFDLVALQDFVKKHADDKTSVFIIGREEEAIAHSGHSIPAERDRVHSDQYREITRAMHGIHGVTRMQLDGEDSLVSFSRNLMTGWSTITIYPYRYIWEQSSAEMARAAGLGLLLLLLTGIVAYLLSDRATQPIREIARAATKIVTGQGSVEKISVSSNDELGDMAKAFNEIRSARDAYQQESERDTLTKLYNRTAIEAFCRRKLKEFDEAGEESGLMAFYIIDLDHFKKANDTFGHQYGDHLLVEFAKNLKKIFRPTDCVGRFGGDEFIVVIDKLPNTDIIIKKATTINQLARELIVDGSAANVTASIGISIAPQHGNTYSDLFKAADEALYHVKNHGRNNYFFADEQGE